MCSAQRCSQFLPFSPGVSVPSCWQELRGAPHPARTARWAFAALPLVADTRPAADSQARRTLLFFYVVPLGAAQLSYSLVTCLSHAARHARCCAPAWALALTRRGTQAREHGGILRGATGALCGFTREERAEHDHRTRAAAQPTQQDHQRIRHRLRLPLFCGSRCLVWREQRGRVSAPPYGA